MNHIEGPLLSRLQLPVDEEAGQNECEQRPASPFAVDEQNVMLTLQRQPTVAGSQEMVNYRQRKKWAAFILPRVIHYRYVILR